MNKTIQEMLRNPETADKAIDYVKNCCRNKRLHPKTLGMLLEQYVNVSQDENDPTAGFSRVVTIKELVENIHPDFETKNGCGWARSEDSYLGKKYMIKRGLKNRKVETIKLDGINRNSAIKRRTIRPDIRKSMENKPCVVLGITTRPEIDHKNGMRDDISNISPETQRAEDFQVLSKPANDAKRQHCKNCRRTGKRFDARMLGFKEGWIAGDADSKTCQGCYWYDPNAFNKTISQDFQKKD